jgi:hypothetical protein
VLPSSSLLHFRLLDLLSVIAPLILARRGGLLGLAPARRQCSGARGPEPFPRTAREFREKSRDSLQKSRYSTDPDHPCARTDGRDRQATWMRSLASVLAKNHR